MCYHVTIGNTSILLDRCICNHAQDECWKAFTNCTSPVITMSYWLQKGDASPSLSQPSHEFCSMPWKQPLKGNEIALSKQATGPFIRAWSWLATVLQDVKPRFFPGLLLRFLAGEPKHNVASDLWPQSILLLVNFLPTSLPFNGMGKSANEGLHTFYHWSAILSHHILPNICRLSSKSICYTAET